MNKYSDVVPVQAPPIIWDIYSIICMSRNGKDTKYTRHITGRIHFVRNGEELNLHKTVWCEGGKKLADIGTKNFRGGEFNTSLEYTKVRLDNR